MPASLACRIALSAVVAITWCSGGFAQQSESNARPAKPRPAKKPAATKPEGVRPAGDSERAPKPQRPQANELRIEPLPAELEQLLKEWEVASAKIEKLIGKHQRIVYNAVFEIEKQAGGEFYYEGPDKGRIDLEGIEPDEGQAAKRRNPKTGNPYRVEADSPSKWICTGKEILTINEEEKTFEAYPLPKELQGKNIIHGPLPFLFGMKADDAKRRFELSFVDQQDKKKNNDKVVWLLAKPRKEMDRENFAEATIILDRKRFLPHAVKLKDPSGNLETVYTFSNLHVNRPEFIPQIFRKDPFHPDLARYKMILPPQAVQADEESEGGRGDPMIKRPIRQTGDASAAAERKGTRPQRTANAGAAPKNRPRPDSH